MSTSAFQNRSGAACAALALVLVSSGCAYGELRQVLRAEVASEADCPDVVIQKSSPYAPGYKENQYTVRGCGVDRIYTCKDDGLVPFGHADCTYTAGATAGKPAAAAAAPAPGGGTDSSDPALAPPPPASDSNEPDDL
jgi:hypothetical protein